MNAEGKGGAAIPRNSVAPPGALLQHSGTVVNTCLSMNQPDQALSVENVASLSRLNLDHATAIPVFARHRCTLIVGAASCQRCWRRCGRASRASPGNPGGWPCLRWPF
jgi:hypothetical protein